MPSSSPDDTVRLFLSYGREDFDAVSDLYDRLEGLGLRPWMDKRDLLPGQQWRVIIPRQVQQCDLVLVCLSPQSVDKQGFFQREIRVALDAWQEKRRDDIYLIPVRLAVCEVPQELEEFNWVDLYDQDGWKMLQRAIEATATSLGRPVPVELVEALASKQKQPPPGPAATPADPVTIASAGARKRLQTEYGELQRQYDTLTSRIAAVDTDLGRALDSEQRLVLDERRAELAGKRSEVSVRMAQIEKELAEPASEQQAAAPPADVAKGEAKPKPVVQVEPTAARPAKPVESAPRDLLIIEKPFLLELVRVPAGEFVMGSDPAKDSGAYDDEKPRHRLFLPDYYIGRYPVTVSQFEAFAQAQKYQTEAEEKGYGSIWTGKDKEWQHVTGASWRHPRGPQSDMTGKGNHPVTQVTLGDVRAFCAWVSQASGGEIRLPSEAEWEKGARWVDRRVYPWGDQAPTAELCNFNLNVGDTTPVERYPKGASRYGALDMAGNVWEWTSSLFKPYPYSSTDGREDESGAGSSVVRGGSYTRDGGFVRCACRGWEDADGRSDGLGFRVVCVSPPS